MGEPDQMVEDRVTIHLIERLRATASRIRWRDLGRATVKAALKEMVKDEDLAAILKNPDRVREWDDVRKAYVHRGEAEAAVGSLARTETAGAGPIHKLQWQNSMSGVHSAATPIGLWYVEPHGNGYAAYSPFAVMALGKGTIDAAKRACEADYADRIKACVLEGLLDA